MSSSSFLLRSLMIVVSFLLLHLVSVSSYDQRFKDCAPFNCNNTNFPNIYYPFGQLTGPGYCGQPAFNIGCLGDNDPAMSIASLEYLVKNVNMSAQTLTIARSDLYRNICAPQYVNTSLDQPLFELTESNRNATLLYGCDPNLTLNPPNYLPLNCRENNGYLAFRMDDAAKCNASRSFVVPILLPIPSETVNAVSILDRGFEVRWNLNPSQCKDCMHSGGHCGYNSMLKELICFCPDGAHPSACPQRRSWMKQNRAIFIVVALLINILVYAIAVWSFKIRKGGVFTWKTLLFIKSKQSSDVEFMQINSSLVPTRYNFGDVKRMTNSFSEKLGQGGFGIVYKGKLRDGRPVAVKILIKSKTTAKEFINEVMSISRTSHINVVTLLGFCYEGDKRALILEYMPNGSLDKFISSRRVLNNVITSLAWKTRYRIALGIAQGLEYLHRGCNTRMLHFDIKPQNILLDADFTPKISDFGHAKLFQGRESAISILEMRGTVGFIAPEVVYKNLGRVSHKSDVYSYGMLMLEMIGLKDNSNADASNESEMYFSEWIYRKLECNENLRLPNIAVEKELDKTLARKMILVSLWCIQTYPSDRPSIGKVIEMLEGRVELLHIPPRPLLYSLTGAYSQHREMPSTESREEVMATNAEEGRTNFWNPVVNNSNECER